VVTSTPPPSSPAEWPALTSVTHRDDVVDSGPCIHLINRPLLSLLLAKLASSTSAEKPPVTYTRVNDFGPHTDSIFFWGGGDLYARATYTRIYTAVQLRHSHGTLLVDQSEVNVSFTPPGDECAITVPLTTPQQHGTIFRCHSIVRYCTDVSKK